MDHTLIIAEAGVNHNGNLDIAKQLVLHAKRCGADIVKFQTAKLDALVSKQAQMADYQRKNIGKEESQKEMLRKLLLPYEAFIELADYCKSVGIQFLSTPFDIESIRFLDDKQDIWKIPSGEITNYPYLVEIGKTGKKVILSTGMCDLQEIHDAVDTLKYAGSKEITLLHCTTEYPAPEDEVNLNAMNVLKKEFNCPVGYSDHTQGVEVSLAAVAMGAKVIEKHFTLDHNMPGPDHKASLDPQELMTMIQGIRKVERVKGCEIKKPTVSELKNRSVARKSIVAARNIFAGEIFTQKNLTTKRPGNGISPMKWNEILGRKAKRNFEEDELIEI